MDWREAVSRRIRMARKRLMVARERLWSATMSWEGADAMNADLGIMIRLSRKASKLASTLRAIERRKDRIT